MLWTFGEGRSSAAVNGPIYMGTDSSTCCGVLTSSPYPSSLAERTLCRQIPKVGARCVNHARRDLCGGCSAMGIPTAIGVPRIIQRKENASEFDYSSFYAKTGARDPLLFGGSPAFLMARFRTAALK